ncbi:MAG: flagellar protein FlgN [Pseudomonadales bacterium]|nr:flagellar protein FlgN [Pseudomonadales bacterium]
MNAPDPDFIKQLMNGIHQELQLFQQLEQLLSAERSALEQRDVQTLTDLVKLKESALSQVEAQVRFRLQLFTERGMPTDEATLLDTMQQLPTKQKKLALKLWDNVSKSLEACHKSNEINARVTHRSQQKNQDMMAILRGGGEKTGLYSPTGKRSQQHNEPTRPAATA